jgi:putative copper resistance protein D
MAQVQAVGKTERFLWSAGILLFVGIVVMFLLAPAWTQHPSVKVAPAMDSMSMPGMDMSHMPDMPGMTHDAAPETPELQRKHAHDKRESEFNHHLAGVLVILAGLFFLVQGNFINRWPAFRYAWPLCFLIGGFFLLLFSDTEIWPFGYMSLSYAVTHNPEDAQHKTFALILLVIGAIEMLRASGRLRAAWSAWVFPVVGIVGSVLLLFHHHGGMHGPNAMATMETVQHQHIGFAAVGFGAAFSKGLSETKSPWNSFLSKLWPLLLIFLGLLLALYHE